MKQKNLLVAAAALTLSACALFAQENQPNPPARPPQGEGAPRRDAPPSAGQRPLPGLFSLLDANHDGVIDSEELAHAADILRTLDRNGDGRITPDELRAAFAGQRPQAGGPGQRGPREGGPQFGEGERRGTQDQAPPRGGPADGQRREGFLRDGERPPGPVLRRDGEITRGPAPDGAQARGPLDRERPENFRGDGQRGRGPGFDGPREQRGPGNGLRGEGPQPPPRGDGPQGPPPGDGPQTEARHHHGAPFGPDGNRFAQRAPLPDFGRGTPRARWEMWMRRGDGATPGPMAMGPRFDERRAFAGPQGRDGFDPREFRSDFGARAPQDGPSAMFPPMPPGPDRQTWMPRPSFPPMLGAPPPQGPAGMQRPDGPRDGRDFETHTPRWDRERRPPGPWQSEIQ